MFDSNDPSPKHAEAREIATRLQSLAQSGAWRKYEGEELVELRSALKLTFGRLFAHETSSGTIAVELALRACEVTAGDEVLIAGYDFPGNFRAIEAIGARPVLVDLAPGRFTLDPEQLQQAIGPTTRAAIVSHLHADLASLAEISDILDRHSITLIEDACQVPGARLSGRPAGSFGKASVLSFGGSKLLSAGRGGAVLTDDPQVAQRLKILNDRGNLAFPMSELQAAVLVPQLKHLSLRHDHRRKAIERIQHECRSVGSEPLDSMFSHLRCDLPESSTAFYKVPLRAPDRTTRDAWIRTLQSQGIAAGEPFRGFWKRTSNRCRTTGELVESRRASETTVLLSFEFLEDDSAVERLIGQLRRLIS